jgi:acyl-CoA hydrolase
MNTSFMSKSNEEMPNSRPVSFSKTIMTELIMPNDTNPLGNLMGGNLMRWMDIAGGICAGRHCGTLVVTASVDHVNFKRAIRLGDVITITATVTKAFNTSVEVYLEVTTTSLRGGIPEKSNHAFMTFVAIDTESKLPTKVPKVELETKAQAKLAEAASRRREVRLIISGRMKAEDASDLRAYFGQMDESEN